MAESKYRNITFLDGLRGLSALYVMISHAKPLLLEGYASEYSQHPEKYTWFGKAIIHLSMLFFYPHLAVLVFFILSGFVISLKYANQLQKNPETQLDTQSYIWRRVKRIYPPFLFSLVLTGLLDYYGVTHNWPLFIAKSDEFIQSGTSLYPNLKVLFGNVVFLMENWVPIWGVNQPLWSLKYEWWFYLLFIPFFYLWKKNPLYPPVVLLLLFIQSYFFDYWLHIPLLTDIFCKMILWWIGVTLADIYTKRISIPFLYLIPTMIFLPISAYLFRMEYNHLNDLIWSIGFIGVFAMLFYLSENNPILRFLQKLKPLGDISYSLYIVHYPILIFAAAWAGVEKLDGDKPETTLYFVGTVIFTLIFAYITYLLVEKPFIQQKKS